MEHFLDALYREVDFYAHYGRQMVFETIFFGGGTPSLLTPGQVEKILAHVRAVFTITPDAEITLETNPETVTQESLVAYRSLGVNRLSVGIQSFHEDELKFLGRIHDCDTAIRCVEMARTAGFDNLNIDLIFSLPGQARQRWEENMKTALALHPDHISAYSLIVEDHTPLQKMVAAKQLAPNPTEREAELYEATMEFMEAHGYEHYEVSNYAKPGYRSRHNYNYWSHKNYLGFGPSAHSFWKNDGESEGRRWWNIANVTTYCSRLAEQSLPLASEEVVTNKELIIERIFLGLRSDGLNLQRLHADLGFELLHYQHGIIDHLLAEKTATLEGESLRLTPKGYLLCDEICERLLPQQS
jgi:oxygen-independent coproporphyrinogen III oxidase